MIIKKINILSAGKIFALLSAITGLLLGITFAVMSILGYSIDAGAESVLIDKTFGFLSIILFPLMYGFFGGISGCVLSFLYNCIASKVGGIDVEVDNRSDLIQGNVTILVQVVNDQLPVLVFELTDSLEVDLVEVEGVNRVMALMARAFHGDPLADMKLVGITGTTGPLSR